MSSVSFLYVYIQRRASCSPYKAWVAWCSPSGGRFLGSGKFSRFQLLWWPNHLFEDEICEAPDRRSDYLSPVQDLDSMQCFSLLFLLFLSSSSQAGNFLCTCMNCPCITKIFFFTFVFLIFLCGGNKVLCISEWFRRWNICPWDLLHTHCRTHPPQTAEHILLRKVSSGTPPEGLSISWSNTTWKMKVHRKYI